MSRLKTKSNFSYQPIVTTVLSYKNTSKFGEISFKASSKKIDKFFFSALEAIPSTPIALWTLLPRKPPPSPTSTRMWVKIIRVCIARIVLIFLLKFEPQFAINYRIYLSPIYIIVLRPPRLPWTRSKPEPPKETSKRKSSRASSTPCKQICKPSRNRQRKTSQIRIYSK